MKIQTHTMLTTKVETMIKYILPALLLFSCSALADELQPANLVGLYEFDVEGSELSIYRFRELSMEINSFRSTGLQALVPDERAFLEFYKIIDGDDLIDDREVFDEIVWQIVFDEMADTNDAYDRTPMTIDRNFKFTYVNGEGRSSRRPVICEVIALSEYEGVVCDDGSKGIMNIVASEDDNTRIDISIDKMPAQRYVKID